MDGSHPRRKPYPDVLRATLLLAAVACPAAAPPASGAQAEQRPLLQVDLSRSLRPVTHCGAGAAWGISRTMPPDDLLAALRPTALRQPATLDGENAGLGALDVRERASRYGAHHVQAVLSDLLPGRPPGWSNLDDWLRLVHAFAERKLRAGHDDVWYDLWADPDLAPPETWAKEGGYLAFWKATHDALRKVDPGAVIVGPSLSAWRRETYREQLGWMRDHGCLPDVVSWNETDGATAIEAHADEYRALVVALGIDERPISIAEYMTRDEVGAPGPAIAHLAALERARVGYACLAHWREPGTMGHLAAQGATLGGFWVYRWYAEMSGRMVSAGPASPGSAGLEALASIDDEQRTASILLTGDRPQLVVYGLGAAPFLLQNGRVHVRIERAPHDAFRPLPSPILVDERDVAVTEHTLQLSVPAEGSDAVHVVLSVPRESRPARARGPRAANDSGRPRSRPSPVPSGPSTRSPHDGTATARRPSARGL